MYAFKVTSTSPRTVRYEITSGELPTGLSLNKDTGGITGVPTAPGTKRFTITARNSGVMPDAEVTYSLRVTRG